MIVLTIVVGVNTAKVEPVKANNDMLNLAVLAQVAEALDPMEDQLTADLNVEPASDVKSIQTQEVSTESVLTTAQAIDIAKSTAVSRNQNPQYTSPSRRETTINQAPVTAATPATSAPVPAPTPAPTEPSTNNKATAIINTAKQYLGVKYVWGGTSSSGFDCSGLVQHVFASHGITLPRVSRDQYLIGNNVDFNNLQPADLVFFSLNGDKVVNHLGIYIGDGQFIHASSSKGVVISEFSSYWTSYYSGAKRVL